MSDMSDNSTKESLVDEYVKADKTSEAVRILFELIVSNAESKNFQKAEALYEKLYEVDPMALTEIVRAGEAIEEAKNQGVDTEHRLIWAGLYDKLSVNEGNALYYGMENVSFKAGEVIIDQGQISNRLFFINKGDIKAVFTREKKDMLLTMLEVGDFFGNEQFFSATVSTISIIAQSNIKASSLDPRIIKKWKTDAPALESKLFDYCHKHDKIKKSIDNKKMERREYNRIQLPVKMIFQFFDTSGALINKSYRGEISDISEGGLSFFIKTTKPEAIRMMLGRQIFVSFQGRGIDGDNHLIEKKGQISAVQSQMFDDFSIHLKFDTPIEKVKFDFLLEEQKQ